MNLNELITKLQELQSPGEIQVLVETSNGNTPIVDIVLDQQWSRSVDENWNQIPYVPEIILLTKPLPEPDSIYDRCEMEP